MPGPVDIITKDIGFKKMVNLNLINRKLAIISKIKMEFKLIT